MEIEKNRELEEYIKKGRWLAWLSYFGLLMIIPAVIHKDNPFVVYHVKQGLVLTITNLVSAFILFIPDVGKALDLFVSVFLMFLTITGIINAITGKIKPLPVIGKIAENLNL
ncbi:hypothetical protein [Hippea alviniae]|uniref:hypothetical protein n=1 Tax=Hippea alviniae TaxID=1279027 RepID=UPI0003B567C7|nr:hypothetical protein [Hippea alviniae]